MANEGSHPDKAELMSRMRPGVLSQAGFLGIDEELDKVIERDQRVLDGCGITHQQIADRLDKLIDMAEQHSNLKASIGKLQIQLQRYPGFQMCPWSSDIHHQMCRVGKGARHASVDWCIWNIETGQKLRGPGLIVHLIGDHHFFEGVESFYRVDPRKLIRLLGLHGAHSQRVTREL